jgi:hypothetical protein
MAGRLLSAVGRIYGDREDRTRPPCSSNPRREREREREYILCMCVIGCKDTKILYALNQTVEKKD